MFYTHCQRWFLRTWLQRSVPHCIIGLSWHHPSCQNFVRFEGAMTFIGIIIVGLMMLLRWKLFPSQQTSTDNGEHRVIAMYKHQRVVIALAVFLLLAWLVVTAWLLIHAGRMFSPSQRYAWVYDKALSRCSQRHCSLWDTHFSHTTTWFTFSQLALWYSIRMSLYTTDMQM